MSNKLSIPKTLYRTATFEREALNEEDRTVEMSISSDAPYRRYFGDEILDHSPASIDMSRMKAGAPLLFNHDRDAHIGRIISAETDGKCLRIKAQFGNSALAQEKFQDVKDGILRETSVGYQVIRMKLEEESEDGDVYRVVSWLPYEGSLVTIPADNSVGVGREDESGTTREVPIENHKSIDNPINPSLHVNQPTKNMPEEPVIDIAAENQKALKAERERVKKINDFVSVAGKHDGIKAKVGDLARQAIENGTDFDSFRCEVLNNWEGATRIENPISEIGMSKKELRQYSLAKAILARSRGDSLTGLEKEASDATAKVLGKQPDGFFIPEDWNNRGLSEIHDLNSRQQAEQLELTRAMIRTLSVGNFASAGALVGTSLLAGSFIELLRNKSVMLSLGPTVLSGLVGNIAIPKQTGAATAYWLGEGATVSASDQTFAQLGMMPHRLVARTAYDKQLLAQSTPSVEALVRNDLAAVLALKKDLACLTGSGSAGEPLGIGNTTGVQTVTFGAAPTWAKLVEFETDIATANADQTGTPVWVTSPAVRAKWKTTAKIGSTFPIYLWGEDNMPNGYKANVTNQVAAATNLVYFFVPSELVIADWAGTDVVVNPYTYDAQGQIVTTITQFTDVGVRHPVAFVVSTDSGAQ